MKRTFNPALASRSRHGSVVLVVLILLSLITVFALANVRIVYHLRAELRQVEQQQLKHWSSVSANPAPAITATNSAPVRP